MEKRNKIWQTSAWFVFLIPLFVVVQIEKNFPHIIPYRLELSNIALLFLAAGVIYYALRVIVRNRQKAGLISLPVLLLYFFFADIKDGLQQANPQAWWSSYKFILPACLVLCVGAAFWLAHKKRNRATIFGYANLLFLIYILVAAGQRMLEEGRNALSLIPAKSWSCDTCKKPDIYYLLFDSYSSSPLLKEQFGYNNAVMDSFLLQNGFFLSTHSRSNYNFTSPSMASILNMQYLDRTDSAKLFTLRDLLPAVEKVYNNIVIPQLEKQGYQFYNLSIFPIKDHPTQTEPFDIWDIRALYSRHHMLKKVYDDLSWHSSWLLKWADRRQIAMHYVDQRDRNFESMRSLLRQTIQNRTDSPKFVYAHSLLPHAPFGFDSTGHKIDFRDYDQEADKQAYIDQLVYTNQVIRETVNDILQNNGRECIIILQSDHAYRFFDPRRKQDEFRNLTAFYFPNHDYRQLNDSVSAVNSFRLLFNIQFGTQMPLARDSSVFLPYRLSF